jgi:hypothetical protein
MTALNSQLLFEIDITVTPPQVLAGTPTGDRRIVTITGGAFEGPRIRGVVLAGGGDWMLLRQDGAIELDVRLTLRTDDDHLIYMTYRGLRHGPAEVMERLNRGEPVPPSAYYFRTAPWFETGSNKYGWLNRICAVAVGDRRPAGPHYTVFEIL